MAGPGLDRRAVLTGLSAALPGVAWAGSPSRDDPAPIDGRLIENLFTRVGAEVTLLGQGPFIFVIDTGAVRTSIGDRLLERLALTPGRQVRVHGITSSEVVPSVDISHLRIYGQRFASLECPVLPHKRLGADGLLGLDVLSRFRLRLNISDRAVSLAVPRRISFGSEARNSRLPGDGMSLERGQLGQMLLNEVSVDRVRTVAFIDSGAQYSIGNLALLRALSLRAGPVGSSPITLYGVTGDALPAELRTVRDLRLGPSRVGSMPLLFADPYCFSAMGLDRQPALLVGADLLGRFREILIDFPRRTIRFDGLRRASPAAMQNLQGSTPPVRPASSSRRRPWPPV